MYSSSACFHDEQPSGHCKEGSVPALNIRPISFPNLDYQTNYSAMPEFQDFIGPYKDHKPPGNRTPAVGEKIWGDVPYLPSYLDPMYTKETDAGQLDNLYFRGPFYKGVSETHSEFVNRGVPPPRQYHKYTRHYEEPGMKHNISVTQSDFQPPHPMLPRDKTPCLKEDPEKSWFKPGCNEPKNPHAKEHEVRPQLPELVFVDDEGYKRDFSTEHNDNYVCYQKEKTGTKIKDPLPVPEERFLKNMREDHQCCDHQPPLQKDELCDGSCRTRKRCPGATPRRISWLLHPKNYSFQNGVMLIPCKCCHADSLQMPPC